MAKAETGSGWVAIHLDWLGWVVGGEKSCIPIINKITETAHWKHTALRPGIPPEKHEEQDEEKIITYNCGILMGAERKVSVLKRAVKTSLICKRKNKLPSQVVSCVGCQDHWRWWLHVYCKGTCLEWLGDEPGRAAVSALMTTVGPLKLWILNIYHTAPHPPRFLSNWSCCSLN